MTEIPISTFFYEYRGERYELHSGGKDYARVTVDGTPTPERFPEALEFGTGPRSPWVMLPRSVFDVGYRQTVRGRWHGAPVSVVSVVRRGPDRGLITVSYDGADPSEAETRVLGEPVHGLGGRRPRGRDRGHHRRDHAAGAPHGLTRTGGPRRGRRPVLVSPP
ncbi:hypothetical protein ACFQBY_05020 [Promicromonospora citrea]|nr:hypothetical protein [Promicromonospora citrea]NNH52484.1 hypothetical protein [Promicromonospora citrea]